MDSNIFRVKTIIEMSFALSIQNPIQIKAQDWTPKLLILKDVYADIQISQIKVI